MSVAAFEEESKAFVSVYGSDVDDSFPNEMMHFIEFIGKEKKCSAGSSPFFTLCNQSVNYSEECLYSKFIPSMQRSRLMVRIHPLIVTIGCWNKLRVRRLPLASH